MASKIEKRDFKWTNDSKSDVKFERNDNGRFNIKIWKPNLIKKLLIYFKLIKDKRYNAKKVNRYLIDEAGHWQTEKPNANLSWNSIDVSKGTFGIDPISKDSESLGSLGSKS